MRGDLELATTLTLHPLLVQMDVCVICSLNLGIGNVDYHQIFPPSTFFQPISPIAENIYNQFSPMNIISWNVRGVAGIDLRRVFNEISSSQEKIEGRPANKLKMETFNNFLHKLNLIDLGFVDPKYNWTNCRQPNSIVRTRIDRAHVNPLWLNIFSETKIIHVLRLTYDHYPSLLKTHPHCIKGEKPFRFDPFWMKHPFFSSLTLSSWTLFPSDLSNTIINFQESLKRWNIKNFGNIHHEIQRTKK